MSLDKIYNDLIDTRNKIEELNSTYEETINFLKRKGKTIRELSRQELSELRQHLKQVFQEEIEKRKAWLKPPSKITH